MGTRSDIIVQLADGRYHRIYCHWDGYIDHNGKILYAHYNSQELAEALVKLGDLSTLGEVTGTKHDFEWRSKLGEKFKKPGSIFPDYAKMEKSAEYKRLRRMCLAYGRDRGEKGCEGKIEDNLSAVWPEEGTWTEFTYVWSRELGGDDFKHGAWWVGDPDESSQTLKLLAEVIAGVATIKTAIKIPFLGATAKVQRL